MTNSIERRLNDFFAAAVSAVKKRQEREATEGRFYEFPAAAAGIHFTVEALARCRAIPQATLEAWAARHYGSYVDFLVEVAEAAL